MSKQQGRIEAFGEAIDECLKSADRGGGSVGARNCMEIRAAISDLWAAAVVDEASRTADQAHRERIHAEIADDLESQSLRKTMDWAGPCIVRTIASGKIRHLRIEY